MTYIAVLSQQLQPQPRRVPPPPRTPHPLGGAAPPPPPGLAASRVYKQTRLDRDGFTSALRNASAAFFFFFLLSGLRTEQLACLSAGLQAGF